MANLADPAVVRFVNEMIRPFADNRLISLGFARVIVLAFDSKNLGALIKAIEDEIEDGSRTDGRTPITAQDVFRIVEEARAFIKNFESDTDSAMLYGKVAVNYRS